MAPKPMPWFRFYSEARRDVKIKKAARAVGTSTMEAMGFWAAILSIANESPVRGGLYVTLHERYCNDDLAIECDMQENTVAGLLEAFQKFDMLARVDGAWHVKNWDKRQYSSDKSTERVKKYREKRRSNNDVTLHKQRCNNNVTPPESDTESDTDTDKEEEAGPPPPLPFQDDCQLESIYTRVTSQIAIPSENRESALGALRAVLASKGSGNEAVVYLLPFYKEWREGRGYAPNNTAWLTDWAVTGEIPKKNGSGGGNSPPQRLSAQDERQASLQRLREKYANGNPG